MSGTKLVSKPLSKGYKSFLILCALVFANAAFAGGPEDTVNVSLVHFPQKSLIHSMGKQQLYELVDYLMEMDTIPLDLAKEISIASERITRLENEARMMVLHDGGTLPASELYEGFDLNKLFPEKDMLKLKGDSSVCLKLSGIEQGVYVPPFVGPITSGFGWRDSTKHNGVDIDLNKGDKVVSAFDGMVRIAKREGGFGNVVIVRHYNGLETVYAHLSKIKVKSGQIVTAGQLLGLGGSTGHSTGTHLHFEVRFKGVPINPKYLICFREQRLLCSELVIKQTKWGLAAYPKDAKFYTIEKGDTIFEIAKRFGTTTASIKQINGFTSGRIRLKVGQQINVQ